MLFHARMRVHLPHDLDQDTADLLKEQERQRAQELQRDGRWRHLWRVAGEYANISVFDVDSPDELHRLISQLPLFPYMDVEVTPLARHPSAIGDEAAFDEPGS